jgi:hypothetical protein
LDRLRDNSGQGIDILQRAATEEPEPEKRASNGHDRPAAVLAAPLREEAQ